MALWDVDLHKWNGTNFKEVRPERVLVEYDGPLTFTFRDESKSLMLAHLSDEDGDTARYIVAPILDRDVERLTRGTASLRAVLNQPIIWVLDVKNGTVSGSWVGTYQDIPNDAKPTDDAMLFAELEPMIKLRVPDVRYRFGAVSVPALRYVIDGAEAALRKLVKHLKPAERTEYQLEAQQLAFNSIEIAFQPRKRIDGGASEPIDKKDKTIPKVVKLLGEGLEWISSGGQSKLSKPHERAILAAVRELTPKKDTPILKIEVSGRVLQSSAAAVPLTVDSRIDITERIKARKPKSIERIGLIRELDEDARTFELREMRGRKSTEFVKLHFQPEQHEDVYKRLGKKIFVRISAEKFKGGAYSLVDLIDESDLA